MQDDMISREATLKPYKNLNDEDTISVWLIRKNIEQQPPVTQKSVGYDDVINQILTKMWNCRGKHTISIDKVKMEQIIRNELSSVTSKPIECDDTVSRGVLEQVMRERDIAIEQLHELGYELGQKIEPCDDIAQERYKDLCEYFGGAKDILKSREDFKAWLGRVKWHIRKAEELYEKYEYKKEPCEDYEDDGWIDDEYGRSIRLEQNKTEVIPPLEPCDDTISRDAVLKTINNNTADERDGWLCIDNDLVHEIEQLPSVTPKSGHWIPIPYELDYETDAECSLCHEKFIAAMDYNYCPKCGCRIQKSEDEG